MIQWCMYCQKFTGEKIPYLDYSITHGICRECASKEPYLKDLTEKTVSLVAFYQRLFKTAYEGDIATTEKMAGDAVQSGYDLVEVALGFIQPALYEIGNKWEKNEISFHDEHRFTAWCRRWVDFVAPKLRPFKGQPDLLIAQTPGNTHELGPNLAALGLQRLGFDVRLFQQPYTNRELSALVGQLQPGAVGFSCALPGMLRGAEALAKTLRDDGYQGNILVSGVACRTTDKHAFGNGMLEVKDIDEAAQVLRSHGSHPV